MPSPSSSRRALSRRTALLGTLVMGGAACTPFSLDDQRRDAGRPAAPVEQPKADPDVALAAAVLAAEQAMVDRIDATLDTHPRLARVLAGTRASHAAHVDLLADAAPQSPGPSASSAPSGTESGTPEPEPEPAPRVSRDAAQALRVLARHEDELSLEDKRSAFAAQSGSFARVLASMAASAAQQSTVLRAARVPARSA